LCGVDYVLADIGGASLEECIKRVMEFLLTDSLARQSPV